MFDGVIANEGVTAAVVRRAARPGGAAAISRCTPEHTTRDCEEGAQA
jgi:hypothetical protein